MLFFFEMGFHFQNVKGFVSVVFPFSTKDNCKQKSVRSLQITLLMMLWINNEIYIKLLNLFWFQESIIYYIPFSPYRYLLCNKQIEKMFMVFLQKLCLTSFRMRKKASLYYHLLIEPGVFVKRCIEVQSRMYQWCIEMYSIVKKYNTPQHRKQQD